MKLSELELIELYRQHTHRAGARDGCLSSEQLVQASLGLPDTEQRRRTIEHLIGCSDCASELRVVRSLRPERRVRPRLRGRAWAWAAVLLVAVGAGWFVDRGSVPPRPSPQRGAQVQPMLAVPADGAVLAGPPKTLAWPPLAGATFRVTMYDANALPLWTSGKSAEPSVEVPEALRQRLAGGGRFSWRVTAEKGMERRSLPMQRFEIRP